VSEVAKLIRNWHMGSKHAEQHKLYHDRSPSRALVVAVTSGLLLGLLIGHMHHQHTQVM
jgi:hypothetical protein